MTDPHDYEHAGVFAAHQAICSNILSIADELEGVENA